MKYIIELKNRFGWFAYQYAGSMYQARQIVARCKAAGAEDVRITEKSVFFGRLQTNPSGGQYEN